MSELWVLIKYQTVTTAAMPRIVTAVALPRSSHLRKHTRTLTRARTHTWPHAYMCAPLQTRTKTDRRCDARAHAHAHALVWQGPWPCGGTELTCCRTWP